MGEITISELLEDSVYQTRKQLSGLKRTLQEYPYALRVLFIVIFIASAFMLVLNKPLKKSTLDELKNRHKNDMHFRNNKL